MASKSASAGMSYSAAMQRVNQIIDAISGDEVDVDELSKHVKEASLLLVQCRDKLLAAESVVKDSLASLQSAAAPPTAGAVPMPGLARRPPADELDEEEDPFAEE